MRRHEPLPVRKMSRPASLAPGDALPRLPVTVIGSYPKPKYVKLTDWFKTGHAEQCKTDVAREAYAKETSQGNAGELEKQLLRGTKEVICEQCTLGVHVPTDGEIRRDNYVYALCRGTEGISFNAEDLTTQNVRGVYEVLCPTVVSKVSARGAPTAVAEWQKAQALCPFVPIKATLPGPASNDSIDLRAKTSVKTTKNRSCRWW